MSQASKIAGLALAGVVALGMTGAANAAPVTAGTAAVKAAAGNGVENVHYRGGFRGGYGFGGGYGYRGYGYRGYRGYGGGFGVGPFVAGALLGTAIGGIASAPAYGYGYPGYGYYRPYYGYGYRPYYSPYSYYGGGWGW